MGGGAVGKRMAQWFTPGRWVLVLLLALVLTIVSPATAPSSAAPDTPAPDEVTLYFFWGDGCPHCAAAKPALAQLQQRYPRLRVRSFEVWNNQDNQRTLAAMADKFGITRVGVPAFFLGQRHWVGFAESTTPRDLDEAIRGCLATGCPDAGAGVITAAAPAVEPRERADDAREVIDVPFVGEVDAASHSLVLSTLLIAAVDGFNPCSLWVLSVLLALTLRTGSRRTIAVIGLVFIVVTALVYALFIAGLFSVFSVVAVAPWVRVAIALIAATFGVINIKDYFSFRTGVSLSIPESAKPGIYQRMRGVLASADSMPALIAATAALAAGVSFVELACTAGFPVLWTNLVAARDVTPMVFVLLLVLYMLVYQFDELLIFGGVVVTMRATRVQEKQGRVLKLVGGMLMLSLALVMLVRPTLMNDVRASLAVFAAAGAATLLVLLGHRAVLALRGARAGDTGAESTVHNRGEGG